MQSDPCHVLPSSMSLVASTGQAYLGNSYLHAFHFAPQPNWGFNADTNIGHGFAIFMAYVGTLRTSCSGAG